MIIHPRKEQHIDLTIEAKSKRILIFRELIMINSLHDFMDKKIIPVMYEVYSFCKTSLRQGNKQEL
jgi:hypothetical protein